MVRIGKSAVIAAFFAGAACVLSAQDEVWTLDGLSGVSIVSLAAGPGVRYAATATGIFRSTEPGVWAALEDSPVNARVLEVDPTDERVVYAGGDWGIEKSTDSGQHFQRLAGAPIRIVKLALDPLSPGHLYVSGETVGPWSGSGWEIHKSTDGGASWSKLAVPPFSRYLHRFGALVVDPTRPGFVYAGSDLSGPEYNPYGNWTFYPRAPVIRTTNAGVSWLPVMTRNQEEVRTLELAIDSFTGAVYAAAYAPGNNEGFVFRSTDAGATWTSASLGIGVRVAALLVVPNEADVIYAATAGPRVLRSVDGGATWSPLGTGQPPGSVSSLAYDPVDGMLRAGTATGIYAIRIAQPPCAPGGGHLCLRSRYRVGVTAENPRTGLSATGVAIPGGSRFGSFSLPAFTGDATLPEVFVKVVESAGSLWVFYGGLTSLPYTMTVTDMVTGRTETYQNDPQNRFCGGVDGDAFPADDVDPCLGCWDYVRSASTAEESSDGTLSLLEGRFSVTLSAYSSHHNSTEPGVAVAKTDRYGYFTLPGFTGDATFPEVYVKMVDFRALTGDFVLFYSGLTSLDYILTVTDEVTGEIRTIQSAGDFCGSAYALPAAH